MDLPRKLTTVAACRVVGIHRDRFNEHVAAGNFDCAPATIAGRARLFDPDAMLALSLFKRNLDDGFDPKRAGVVACAVAQMATQYRDERAIGYLETFVGMAVAMPASLIPDPRKWAFGSEAGLDNSGLTIRKISIFNVAQLRAIIEHGTDEEFSIAGERDE